MTIIRCPRCGDLVLSGGCMCKAYHIVFEDWHGDEPKTIWAHSPEAAVERLARRVNEDDPIVNDNVFPQAVEVTDEETGVSRYFQCYAEPEIHYSVHELDDERPRARE